MISDAVDTQALPEPALPAQSAIETAADPGIVRYANMFGALGNPARLSIVRLLLSAHPDGMVVGELQAELGISGSNLSHHLEKLKHEGLVSVVREGTFLRYSASTAALQELLGFLYAECCTRNKAIRPGAITKPCK